MIDENKRLGEDIRKCVWFKDKEYVAVLCDDGNTEHNIYFDLPFNDMKRLMKICIAREHMLEVSGMRVRIFVDGEVTNK